MRLLLVKTPTVIVTISLMATLLVLAFMYLFPLAVLLGVIIGGN